MKFFTKSVLALVAFVSFSAQAADLTTSLGGITVPSSINYGNTHSALELNTTFWDDFTFTLTDASANSVTSSISLSNLLGIDNMSARLYTGSTHQTGAVVPGTLMSAWGTVANLGSGVGITTVVLNPLVLAAGTYTLQLKGTVVGSAGGSYAGVLNVAPVPEPETNAMLLSGLLLIGFAASKRRNNA